MTASSEPRRPRIFRPDDPNVSPAPPPGARTDESARSHTGRPDQPGAGGAPTARDRSRDRPVDGSTRPTPAFAGRPRPTLADLQGGIRWGAILVSAATALATLAAGLWFARFVSVALAREDWIGWAATALLAVMALAGSVIVGREIVGLSRLARLAALRRNAERALAGRDAKLERATIAELKPLFGARPDRRWALARLDEHQADVRDPGELLRLADRELVAPLDVEARRIVMTSAKRVGVVTAMSPLMLIAVLFVLVENVRMLRAIATVYGGRPGTAGALKLGRMVVGHLVAAGGVALTEDLVGQFLGQDLLRRLSRRLGEGAFNGALTARIGAAAIGIIRPLPYIEARPVRVRDLLAELFKRKPGEPAPKSETNDTD